MMELRDWLIEGDPVADESSLSGADLQRMRRAIVAAAESHDSPLSDWARGSWAAATVLVAVAIAVGMSRWMEHPRSVPDTHQSATSSADHEAIAAPRQMQLIAPRGTRVIWIFNDEFNP
jgi:hypothetical protein